MSGAVSKETEEQQDEKDAHNEGGCDSDDRVSQYGGYSIFIVFWEGMGILPIFGDLVVGVVIVIVVIRLEVKEVVYISPRYSYNFV